MKKAIILLLFLSAGVFYGQNVEIFKGELKAQLPGQARKGIAWSPKGEKAKFTNSIPISEKNKKTIEQLIDPVWGFIKAADSTNNKIIFALAKKSAESLYRERLIIDCDNDGVLNPETETFDTEAKESRGRMWVSHNGIKVKIKFPKESLIHMVNMWHVYPKPGEEGEYDVIRFSRSSWLEGKIGIDGKDYRIALIDADNTLSFSMDDVWVLLEEGNYTDSLISKSFGVPLSKPNFIGGQAYRLVNFNEAGTIAEIRKTDDKKEVLEQKEEPVREKSAITLSWMYDFDAAVDLAKKENKKLFIKWWADWCGPCKELEKTTLQDKKVVEILSRDYITASIDHDKEYLTAQKQMVKALPTLQFFGKDGKEIKRYVGFLTAAELEKLLNELN